MISEIGAGAPLAERSLRELGVPAFDIVRIEGEEGTGFFLLAGDRDDVLGPGAVSRLESASPAVHP